MQTKCLLTTGLLLCVGFCQSQTPQTEAIQQSLPHISDSLAYVNALNRLAMLLYEKNIDSTFYYTRQAREIADRQQYARGKADALNNMGVVYDIKGNIQFALRYYNEAYNSYLALGDSSNIVQTLMNIAEVYQETGKDEKAIAHYKRALTLGNRLSHDSIQSLVIFNYLLKYPDKVSPDSVDWYFEKARSIAAKYNDHRVLLVLDQIKADNAIKNDHREEGIALLRQIIDKAISSHLYFLSLDLQIDIGDHLVGTDTALAMAYYKQGLAISDQKGYLIYSQSLARRLYDFYTAHKDNVAAFYYSRRLVQLNDQQNELNNSSAVDYIDYALKDEQLEAFRVRSNYQSAFLSLAGVICIMTIVIIIILWRNWKKTQQTASMLRLQFEQSEATTGALDSINKNYARLLKVVAHDLRNPIGAIGTISTMLGKTVSGSEEGRLIQMIHISAQTSLGLINELLATDFEEQQHLVREELNLDLLLRQNVELLRFRANDKGQELVFESDKNLRVVVDKEKISRVISNLIGNAIKFSPEDSAIIVTARGKNDGLVISVKDAGIGIPEDMQSRIFDPFTTAKRRGTGGEQPFGLGLYISKQIVEAHQGRIRVVSEVGEGTEFLVELPI